MFVFLRHCLRSFLHGLLAFLEPRRSSTLLLIAFALGFSAFFSTNRAEASTTCPRAYLTGHFIGYENTETCISQYTTVFPTEGFYLGESELEIRVLIFSGGAITGRVPTLSSATPGLCQPTQDGRLLPVAVGDCYFSFSYTNDGGETISSSNIKVFIFQLDPVHHSPIKFNAEMSTFIVHGGGFDKTARTIAGIALGGFLSDRANLIASNLFDMNRGMGRLDAAHGGSGQGSSSGFTTDQGLAQARPLASGLDAQSGTTKGLVIPAMDSGFQPSVGTSDPYGFQAILAHAMQSATSSGTMDQYNYSGAFDASLNLHDGFAGSFHTSLSQMMKFSEDAQHKEAASLGLNASGSGYAYSPLDLWMEGTYTGYGGERSGSFGLFSVGTDYVFNPNFMAGIFAQGDTMKQTSDTTAEGTGWMAGPYATLRLADNLFWNGRVAFGRSGNTLEGSGDFRSSRWLASTSLMGQWQLSNRFTLAPDLGFTYFSDATEAYVDSSSTTIPGVKTELGQLKLSPKLAYAFASDSGYWIEPSFAPELIWNFASTNIDGLGALSETATGPTGLRGRVKADLAVKSPGGTSFGASASYDGIGSSGYSSVSGQVQVNLPLN